MRVERHVRWPSFAPALAGPGREPVRHVRWPRAGMVAFARAWGQGVSVGRSAEPGVGLGDSEARARTCAPRAMTGPWRRLWLTPGRDLGVSVVAVPCRAGAMVFGPARGQATVRRAQRLSPGWVVGEVAGDVWWVVVDPLAGEVCRGRRVKLLDGVGRVGGQPCRRRTLSLGRVVAWVAGAAGRVWAWVSADGGGVLSV